MQETYRVHSRNQYSAHEGCQDLLDDCMIRLSQRANVAWHSNPSNMVIRMADLGSADGTNSIQTWKRAISSLHQQSAHVAAMIPLHITFEEHPSSNEDILQQTLDRHQSYFQSVNVTPSILMKSFYDPALFPAQSMDFIMSYISLHWLDTSTTTTTSSLLQDNTNTVYEWKTKGNNTSSFLTQFTHVQEKICQQPQQQPQEEQFKQLQQYWKHELAKKHLARFLQYRAEELKPGGEMLLMMVSQPNEFIQPSSLSSSFNNSNNHNNPLTIALQRLVQQGVIRKQILEQCIIPYYLRTEEDIHLALDEYKTINDGSYLQLIDIRSYPATVAPVQPPDNDNDNDGDYKENNFNDDSSSSSSSSSSSGSSKMVQAYYNLFWAIHGSVVQATHPTSHEFKAIQKCLQHEVFPELYSLNEDGGLTITFLACVLRKRTRKSWT